MTAAIPIRALFKSPLTLPAGPYMTMLWKKTVTEHFKPDTQNN